MGAIHHRWVSVVIVVCTLFAAGCQSEPPAQPAAQEPAAPGSEGGTATEKLAPQLPAITMPDTTHTRLATGTETAPGWTVLDEAQLSAGQAAQLGKAREAERDLGKRIRGRLDAELASGGYAAAYSVCKCATRPLCEGVGLDHGLKAGRTSFRLRDGNNAPPAWAKPVVDAVSDAPHVFGGPEGKLATLSPIWLDDVCTGCHGTPDALAEGIPQLIAETFPDDQARGFEPGELRGYVWIEVPGQ